MPTVDHVLLTRFSAVLAPGAPPAPEDWLQYRLGFFYDVTWPSVRAQTVPPTWLVLLDDRCSDGFRATVEELAEGVFVPVWTHEPFRRDSFAAPVVAATEGSGATHLITTRLDSDDAVAVDFCAAVRRELASEEGLFVNFTRGLQIDRSGAVLRTDVVSSPFLSFAERRRPGVPPETVFVVKHARARSHAPVREVRAPPMWVQVVHDANLSNIVNGTRVDPSVVAERFRVTLPFDAHPGRRELAAGQVAQAGLLARLWAAHPGELVKWVEGRAASARGTHVRPRNDGSSLADRVRDRERAARAGWARSPVRRAAVGTHHALLRGRRSLLRRVDERAGGLRLLAGDLEGALAADRVVVLAEFDRGTRVRASSLDLAAEWRRLGFGVVLVAARDAARLARLRRPEVPDGVAVLARPNLGHDFGSWSAVLAAHPGLAARDTVVLTNDSLWRLGPLDEVARRVAATTADVWGGTARPWPRPHLQSCLLAFRGGVLSREPLRSFLAGVRPQPTKRAVIEAYELGLGDLLGEAGLTRDVGWPGDVGEGWRTAVAAGFPFVKRTLLTDRAFAGERAAVREVLRRGRPGV